jgi:zinc/manganese transport system ATP-binding protein
MIQSLFPEKRPLTKTKIYDTHHHADDLIRLDNLSVHYRQHIALERITGAFERGSLTAIIGPNGGGKSTLLKAILGMVPRTTGRVSLNQTLSGTISYLPQQVEMDRSFPLTVQDVVASGHCQHEGFFNRFDQGLQKKVEDALQEVGMLDCMNRALDELSGGQFQRVLFARLALQNADCILLDEPFTAIDSYTVQDLIKIILNWHTQGKTLLVVNHDLDLVQDHFPRALMIARRVLEWGPTKDVVTLENLKRAKHISRHLESIDGSVDETIFSSSAPTKKRTP